MRKIIKICNKGANWGLETAAEEHQLWSETSAKAQTLFRNSIRGTISGKK
jgi:hypothetical protein